MLYTNYAGKKLEVKFERYKTNNATAIELHTSQPEIDSQYDTESLWATATANASTPFQNPFEEYNPSLVAIKDYGENEGMYKALVESGIIEKEPKEYIHSGMVKIPVAVLTEKALEEAKSQMPEVGQEIDNELEKKREYSFENIKKQLDLMMDNNYEGYVKAQLSLEKGVNNQEVLDRIYDKFMENDNLTGMLNDGFNDLIDESENEISEKDNLNKKQAMHRLNQQER